MYKDGKIIFRFRIILAFIIGKYGTETLTNQTEKKSLTILAFMNIKKNKIESLQQRQEEMLQGWKSNFQEKKLSYYKRNLYNCFINFENLIIFLEIDAIFDPFHKPISYFTFNFCFSLFLTRFFYSFPFLHMNQKNLDMTLLTKIFFSIIILR